jgi:hypothetical protein
LNANSLVSLPWLPLLNNVNHLPSRKPLVTVTPFLVQRDLRIRKRRHLNMTDIPDNDDLNKIIMDNVFSET